MSAPDVVITQVGPSGRTAADGAFGVALTTLWHRTVSEGDGGLGFVPPVERPAVAAESAAVVDAIKRGRAHGIAAHVGRVLAGFALLEPGARVFSHTAVLGRVMVDPQHQRAGLGDAVVGRALDLAVALRIERVSLSMRQGSGLEEFYGRFGFLEVGRRPGWIRVGPGDDRDEVLMAAVLEASS